MVGIYAMGGGYGHIARACALGRSLTQARPGIELCLYLPQRGKDWVSKFGLRGELAPESPRHRARWIEHRISVDRPNLLVADCFARGFRGELAAVLPNVQKTVFLTRWLDQSSVTAEDWKALENFTCRLSSESVDGKFASLGFQQVEPILAASADEVVDRAVARANLGLSQHSKVVMCSRTYLHALSHQMESALERLQDRYGFELLLLEPGGKLWQQTLPLARQMRAANLVVALPGYNTYHEVVQAGVPAIFVPSELANDNHHQRCRGELGPSHPAIRWAAPDGLATLIPEMLEQELQPRQPFHGATQAAAAILKVLDSATISTRFQGQTYV